MRKGPQDRAYKGLGSKEAAGRARTFGFAVPFLLSDSLHQRDAAVDLSYRAERGGLWLN